MDPFLDQPREEAAARDVLLITVRFTNSFDLPLDIPNPHETSVVALKHLVRSKLDPPLARQRYRFIYRGRLLGDDDILTEVLKVPSAPPRMPDPMGKGKAVEPPPPRVYLNCSLGDTLTPLELFAEADAAKQSYGKARTRSVPLPDQNPQAAPATPRGFDRLLAGGFTVAEVNQLRLQFRSLQESIHTPETMPSPNSLIRIEDAWIDDNSGAGPGAGVDFGDDGLGGGAIDDILWGNLMGFLWPLGCVGFLMRESGALSRRRQVAVLTGFTLSLAYGILRALS